MDIYKQMEIEFQNMISKYGWASHYVPLDDNHINYHTHGLQDGYNHPDIQIVLPLDMDTAHTITSDIVKSIQAGTVFYENMKYIGYVRDDAIEFVSFMDYGRPVLRVIFPDKNGLMPQDEGCNEIFKCQLDELEE